MYLTMLLGLAACGEEVKEEGTSSENEKKDTKTSVPADEEKESVSAQWLYDISPSGLITVSNKEADLNFHAKIEIEGAGLTFSKEFEQNEDGVIEARFPQDFGIDEFDNPLWNVVDGNIFDCEVRLSANDEEIVKEKAKLPVDKSGTLKPLYSDQVEFEQNPHLPNEVGGTDNKAWIKFYADKVGFHYLSASHDGHYKHFTQTTDGAIELVHEKTLAEIDCESGSIRMGYTDPEIADANGDHEMEVYVASVNSCIDDERYIAWAEQRGEVLGERASKSKDAPEDFSKTPSNNQVGEMLTDYLRLIFEY